jgi:hypothetical protein
VALDVGLIRCEIWCEEFAAEGSWSEARPPGSPDSLVLVGHHRTPSPRTLRVP